MRRRISRVEAMVDQRLGRKEAQKAQKTESVFLRIL
jgi:hypothetical protein